MDPVTHVLSGAVLRNIGFKRRGALLVLVLFSVLPDIDYATKLLGDDYFLEYHRGITHGIPALFAVTLFVFFLVGPRKGGFYYSSLGFLGYGLHIFLDLTNQYGVRLFAPLDYQMHSMDLTFIIDPYVSAGFLVSLIAIKFNKENRRMIALLTMFLLVSYVEIRQHYHEKTMEFIRNAEKGFIVRRVCPLPNDFLRWWFVANSENEIKVGFADLFTQKVYIHKTYKRHNDPVIESSKQTRLIKKFLYFARQPHAEAHKEGDKTVVTWRELSYAYAPGDHFVAKVVIDSNGKVLSSDFKL
jgi:inner membrane protein